MSGSKLSFQIHLTNDCNLRCYHCYNRNNATYLSAQEFDHVLREARSLIAHAGASPDWACFCGGEPTLSPILLESIEKMRRAGFTEAAVYTNGVAVTPEFAEKLARSGCGYAQICIEGGAATHEAIRGCSLERTQDAWRVCRSAGLRVNNQTTINDQNYHEIDEIIAACEGRVDFTCLVKEIPRIGKPRTLEPAAWYEVMERLLCQYYLQDDRFVKTVVVKDNVWSTLFFDTGYSCVFEKPNQMRLLTVECNGDVYPCRRAGIAIGNVFEKSLIEIYSEFCGKASARQGTATAAPYFCSALACPGIARWHGGTELSSDPFSHLTAYTHGADGEQPPDTNPGQSTFRLGGAAASIDALLTYWQLSAASGGVLAALVSRKLGATAAVNFGIEVSAQELQRGANMYRRARGLRSAAETLEWLKSAQVSVDSFEEYVEAGLLVSKLKERIAKEQQASSAVERDLAFDSWLGERLARTA